MKIENRYPRCPGPLCTAQLMPGHVLCASCWSKVPASVREVVAATWRADAPSPDHRRAIDVAIRALKRGLVDIE